MYAGRMGYGASLPYSLGERNIDNLTLGEVSPRGYGPYLGNFFDTIKNFATSVENVATKIGIASGQLSQVASGQANVATIPTNKATITIPTGNSGVGVSVPLVPLAIGAGVLLFLALRKRR